MNYIAIVIDGGIFVRKEDNHDNWESDCHSQSERRCGKDNHGCESGCRPGSKKTESIAGGSGSPGRCGQSSGVIQTGANETDCFQSDAGNDRFGYVQL